MASSLDDPKTSAEDRLLFAIAARKGPVRERRMMPFSKIRLLTSMMALPMMAWLLLSRCTSPDDDAPITCDALQRCEGQDAGISINQLQCRAQIDDPACGQAYRTWLQCYSESCTPSPDGGAGAEVCPAQRKTLLKCRNTPRSDATAE
jgi:hypothetical protein